ncbi:MAG: ABC transporter permease [Blastocatellia bacterium]
MHSFWQDLRYGARMLLKQPGFTLIAVLTLALGIGANTAIFSVVNAVLLRSLPYPQAEQLMKVVQGNTNPGKAPTPVFWSYPRFEALRDLNQSFTNVAAYATRAYNLTGADEPERLEAEYVSAAYFQVLGIGTVVGRTFAPEEDKPAGAAPVVLISHKLWQRRFGGDPQLVGRTIELEKITLTVVGILPPNFNGQYGTVDVWLPMMMVPKLMSAQMLTQPRSYWIQVVARVKPGVTRAQAQAEMNSLSEQIERLYPGPTQSRPSGSGKEVATLVPLQEAQVSPAFRRSFLLLLAAVGFVLLIACANTANLLLARAAARQREFAVRLALGAGRARLLRQLLTESLLLALCGGAFGLLVALWGVDLLNQFKPTDSGQFWTQYAQVFRFFTIRLDASVLAFNFALAALTGVLFGLLPAWQATRPDLNLALKEGTGSTVAGLRGLWYSARGALIIVEIALSLVLLTGAGLMIRSLVELQAVNLGFNPHNLLTMRLTGRGTELSFYQQLRERVAALPGVEAVSVADSAPLSGFGATVPVEIEGRPTNAAAPIYAPLFNVSPDYFHTLGIRLLKGRGLTEQDRPGAPRVALINATAAARLFPGEDPLGKRFTTPYPASYPGAEPLIEIVGVVDDVKYGRIEDEVEPGIYLSAWQPTNLPSLLIIRTGRAEVSSLLAAVRNEVKKLDRNMPVQAVKTMRERSAEMTSRMRFIALMLSLFAALALVLSAIGIYGVMSYVVAGRTREIGIRLALGAQRKEVLRLVLLSGLRLTLSGLLLGLAASLATTRALQSQLYGVSATDPRTFAGIAMLLALVALLACWLPARRATKVDPLVALRCE